MLTFHAITTLQNRTPSELLVFPFFQKDKKPHIATTAEKLPTAFKEVLVTGDFKAKTGELVLLYTSDKKEKRVALLGLGEKEKLTVEELRRAYSKVTETSHKLKLKKIAAIVPQIEGIASEEVLEGLAEGILLPNYFFNDHKHDSIKEDPSIALEHVQLIGVSPKQLKVAEECAVIAESVYLARNLVNSNADDVTPQYLAATAKKIAAKSTKLKATILNKKQLIKEKFDLLLSVNRGSHNEPVLIILQYKGDPKSSQHIVIVGKGVTYDTGGLNLKPTGSMETMKCDMAGAAAVLSTIQAIAALGLKVNVTAVVPSTENSIDSRSYKPGDVYSSYLGKTVEIGNTDAEGRLILADALAYACKKLKPTQIIDFATLTGAIVIALGNDAAGLMSTNDALADGLIAAGARVHERVWRLPLYKEYRKQLDSDVADIKNVGGREAGSITAAWFLREFVGETPWAHIDIAGTAFLSKGHTYVPKNATGIGVRLMVRYLQNL